MAHTLLRSTLFIIFFQAFSNVFAQDVDTVFFSSNNDNTTREKAMFYVLRDSVKTENAEKSWLQKKYFLSHEISQVCPVVEVKENSKIKIVQNGICRDYYKSGKLKGLYPQQRGVPYGSFEKYYEDGQLMQIGQYDGWDKEYVFHFYDEKGNDVLVKGSGVFRQYKENLNNYVFYYTKDSALQYSYMIDEEFKDTIYLSTDTIADFGDGFNKLHRKLAKVKVPLETIKKYSRIGLRYRVVVMENGKFDRVKPIGSVDSTVDDLFINCIRKYGNLKPQSLKNGQKIKIYLFIPVRLIYLE